MKKFKGLRKYDDIIKDAKNLGFEVDTTGYDNGDDGIWLRDLDLNGRLEQVYINMFNGNFGIYFPESETKAYATHLSEEFDNEDWYNEILDLIYEI